MPPIHPAFVHFPIALVVFSFIADLLGRILNRPALRAAGAWALLGALVFGAITVGTGYWDFDRTEPVLGGTQRYVDFHQDIGWVVASAILVLTLWRWLSFVRRDRIPGVLYLLAALLVTALVLFQGWYGGEMVYSQGAGVAAAGKGTESPSQGKQRLDRVTEGDE